MEFLCRLLVMANRGRKYGFECGVLLECWS